jgi:hypothetical protein
VSLVVSGGQLEFTLSYIVDYANRTAMKDLLFTQIVEQVMSSDGRLAWASSTSGANTTSAAVDPLPPDAFRMLRQ